MDPDSRSYKLFKDLITSLVFKSFFGKTKGLLNEELHDFLPPDRINPLYIHTDESSDNPDASILMDKLNSKEQAETISALLHDSSKLQSEPEVIKEIFLEVVLKRATRSVEHVNRILMFYLAVFQGLYHQQPES